MKNKNFEVSRRNLLGLIGVTGVTAAVPQVLAGEQDPLEHIVLAPHDFNPVEAYKWARKTLNIPSDGGTTDYYDAATKRRLEGLKGLQPVQVRYVNTKDRTIGATFEDSAKVNLVVDGN
jgi:hypothetical protein